MPLTEQNGISAGMRKSTLATSHDYYPTKRIQLRATARLQIYDTPRVSNFTKRFRRAIKLKADTKLKQEKYAWGCSWK